MPKDAPDEPDTLQQILSDVDKLIMPGVCISIIYHESNSSSLCLHAVSSVCLEILWVDKEVKSNTVYPIAAKFITRRGIGEMYVAWV